MVAAFQVLKIHKKKRSALSGSNAGNVPVQNR